MNSIFNFNIKNSKTKKLENKGALEIKNATEDRAELYFYGDIVSNSWQSYWYEEDKAPQDIVDFLNQIEDTKELNIYINSGGGSVYGGLAIYNILKRHKGKKIVTVDGIAASIASIIALAGDEIIISKSAQFMIHKPWIQCSGNASELRAAEDVLDKCQKSITAIYMENVLEGISEETITQLINKETWMTGEEASKYFNIKVDDDKEIFACESDYFEKYNNTPSTIMNQKKNNEKFLSDDHIEQITDKVLKCIDNKKKDEEKIKILNDISLISFM